MVFVTNVRPPKKWRRTKPPRTVLISGIPLCLAWGENSRTRRLAHAAKRTYLLSAPCPISFLILVMETTYRIQHKEDVLHHPFPTLTRDAHALAPGIPIMALLHFRITPAAKRLVQVEPPVSFSVTAVARFEIGQPITRDINKGSDASTQYASSNQNDPHLTGIRKLLHLSQHTTCARVQVSQSLSLLGVLKDPVNGCEIIVADAASRPFDIPISSRCILCVLNTIASTARGVEIVEDKLGRVVGVGVIAAETIDTRIRRKEAREAEGGRRGFRFALE